MSSSELQDQIQRLGAENEELRSQLRIPPEPASPPDVGEAHPVRVLLLPDPAEPTRPGKPGPEAFRNLARTMVSLLRDKHPEVDWRAEDDLSLIPADAECFRLGDVVRRMWEGTGPDPATFRVEVAEDGTAKLRRCLVPGERDSDRFSKGYSEQIQIVDDLVEEGEAAYRAGAQHHATWILRATDLVLSRLELAFARFEAGRDDWRDPLDAKRPEYNPGYRVDSQFPPGL